MQNLSNPEYFLYTVLKYLSFFREAENNSEQNVVILEAMLWSRSWSRKEPKLLTGAGAGAEAGI
jgi:hypothetical protein